MILHQIRLIQSSSEAEN